MRFTDIFIRRPVLAAAISMLIIILGLQAVSKLTVREYPEMTTTVINVTTVYPGADANLIQAFVTSQLEEAIAQADNIDYITSSSRQSSSQITVKMKLNTDPNAALADVLSKVNSVRSALPKEINDPVITSSSGGSGMMYISFTSDVLDSSQVTDYIQRVVKPQFFTIPGVAKVDIFGGSPYAMRIWLDPEKMANLKLSAPQVMQALSSNNVQTAAGSANGWFTVIKNKVNTTTTDVQQLKDLVVHAEGDNLIHLSDIATVELTKESNNFRAAANGKEAVVLSIEPSSSANPLTVIKNIYPLFDTIQRNLPPDIDGKILYDKTIAINSSIEEVVKTILEATVIVLVVITMFLGSFRAMIVPVVTIPISLIGVIMLLQAFDFSINLMTLLAMILAIGLVVDDAIVVLENVDRHIKLGETPFRAAIIGTREIALPVISMTIALCAVYSPMALMGGITGALFKEFALTLAGAVFISGIIALTLSPMMCSKLLKAHTNPSWLERRVESFLSHLTSTYNTLLGVVMYSRKWILGFAILIFASLPLLFSQLSSELTPSEDKGALLSIGTTSADRNVDYVQIAMKKFEALLKEIPEVQFSQVISGVPASNQALAIATLVDWSERNRSQAEIMKELNAKAKSIPEISVSGFPFPEINTGEQGMPVSFVIMTPNDYRELANITQHIWEEAQKSGQFIFSNIDLKFDTAEMTMSIDRDKANSYGITMSQISTTVGSFLSSATVTRVDLQGRAYKIISGIERKKRLNPESMNNFYLIASDGSAVPLSSLVTLELKTQPLSLPRFNQLNSAVISGVPTGSVGDAVKWFQTVGADMLPQGYTYDFRGESRQFVQEGNTLATTFALAVIIIFLVLAIQFESIRDPLVIIVSVPLAISGALLGLNLLGFLGVPGSTLNIYSEVGLITLVGLITKHGILMCEVAKEEQLLHGKTRIEAIMEAAHIRLRPILMTTAAMIAGLIPLLYAAGAGAVSRFSIGAVIIAGLAIGTLFTLFILPVIYSFIATEHKPLPEFDETQPPRT